MDKVENLEKKNRELQMHIHSLNEELHQTTVARNTAIFLMLLAAFLGFIVNPSFC